MIPHMTAREDNVFMIGNYIAKNIGDVVERWELCAFNNLCKDKYMRLGQQWQLENVLPIPEETMMPATDRKLKQGAPDGVLVVPDPESLESPSMNDHRSMDIDLR